ncbi:hypothetical protein ALT1644_460015 [Alteromonas macleodii]
MAAMRLFSTPILLATPCAGRPQSGRDDVGPDPSADADRG